jgi:PleD family two-component response regulator
MLLQPLKVASSAAAAAIAATTAHRGSEQQLCIARLPLLVLQPLLHRVVQTRTAAAAATATVPKTARSKSAAATAADAAECEDRRRSSSEATGMQTLQQLQQPLSVLVVDDEASIRAFMSRMFVKRGYAVSQAADGDEALRRMQTQLFEAVLLDLNM